MIYDCSHYIRFKGWTGFMLGLKILFLFILKPTYNNELIEAALIFIYMEYSFLQKHKNKNQMCDMYEKNICTN